MLVQQERAPWRDDAFPAASRLRVAMRRARRDGWPLLAACAVLLVAALLRLSHLNFHSLDLDESVSVWLAAKPVGELVTNTLNLSWDPHPPGYYLTLKAWTTLFGNGEFSVRLLSALFGIALTWLVYLVGAQLFGLWAGVAAAALVAVNPLLVWLSQEVRMYVPATALALGSIYCLLQAVKQRGWAWWAGYAALAVTAAYSHISGSFLLPAAALYLVARGWRERALWRVGLPVVMLSGLTYVPFARNAWQASGVALEINVYPRLNLGEQLWALAQSFALRFVPETPAWLWIPVSLLVLVWLAGVVLGGAQRNDGRSQRAPGFLVLVWVLVPLGAFLWLNSRRPAFNPKYLAPVLPAVWIGVGAGIARLSRWRRWLGGVAAVSPLLLAALGWPYVWSTDALREDWRTAAKYVSDRATSDDTVFVHLHYARIPFEYYYSGAAGVVAPLGSRPPSDEAELDGPLRPYSGSDVIWLVQSQEHNTDPRHVVEAWFAGRGPMATEQYPVGMSVKAFVMRYRLPDLPERALPSRIRFGSSPTLAGYEIDQSRLRPDSDRLHPPSNWIHLTLYWRVDERLEQAFDTAVEMTDDNGGIWGGKLEQPRSTLRFYPPTQWQPGEVVRDDYDLNLNPVAPDGTYHIRVGVYGEDGTFWSMSGAAGSDGRAVLTDVQIENVR